MKKARSENRAFVCLEKEAQTSRQAMPQDAIIGEATIANSYLGTDGSPPSITLQTLFDHPCYTLPANLNTTRSNDLHTENCSCSFSCDICIFISCEQQFHSEPWFFPSEKCCGPNCCLNILIVLRGRSTHATPTFPRLKV